MIFADKMLTTAIADHCTIPYYMVCGSVSILGRLHRSTVSISVQLVGECRELCNNEKELPPKQSQKSLGQVTIDLYSFISLLRKPFSSSIKRKYNETQNPSLMHCVIGFITFAMFVYAIN